MFMSVFTILCFNSLLSIPSGWNLRLAVEVALPKHGEFGAITNILNLWKFNIAPENKPSQKESSLPTIHFQGLC